MRRVLQVFCLCAEQVVISMAEKVLINFCVVDELLEIPGIGPIIANRIVEYRKAHGDFTVESFSALAHVKNLSEVLSYLDFSSCPLEQEEVVFAGAEKSPLPSLEQQSKSKTPVSKDSALGIKPYPYEYFPPPVDGRTKASDTVQDPSFHSDQPDPKTDMHQNGQGAASVTFDDTVRPSGVDTLVETEQNSVPSASQMNHGSGVFQSGSRDFSQEPWYHKSSDYGNRRSKTGGSSQKSRKQHDRAHRQRNVRHERMEATPLVSVPHHSRTESPYQGESSQHEDGDSSQEEDYQSEHYVADNAEIDRRLSTRLWELLGMRCSDVDSSHHSKPHRSAEVPRRTSNSERDPSSQHLRDNPSHGKPSRSTRSGTCRVAERQQSRTRQPAEFAGPPPVRRTSPSVPTDFDYQDSRPLSARSPVDHRSTSARSPVDHRSTVCTFSG